MNQIKEVKENNQFPAIPVVTYYPVLTSLKCELDNITAHLDDGRVISIPTAWFPRLRKATLEQLSNFVIAFDGEDVTWPQLDVDISVKSFTDGLNARCCC